MVMNIASLASSLKAQELQLAVGTRLVGMAKNAMEVQAGDLLKLLESAKVLELSVNPHLGSILDVEA